MPLSKREEEELKVLEDPNVEYLSSSFGPIFSWLFGIKSQLKSRKKRVVELRSKIRMEGSNLDPKKDQQKYKEIQREEDQRFDRIVIYKIDTSVFKNNNELKKEGKGQCQVCGNIQEYKLKNCQKCSNEME